VVVVVVVGEGGGGGGWLLVWGVGCVVGDGDFFSIFFRGLHELFLIEKSLEIAAYRGWGFLLGCMSCF
jgi:hypothetical protein